MQEREFDFIQFSPRWIENSIETEKNTHTHIPIDREQKKGRKPTKNKSQTKNNDNITIIARHDMNITND